MTHDETDRYNALRESHERFRVACEKHLASFEYMFSQCLSNGMKNAWGHSVDCTLINESNSTSRAALAACPKIEVPK